jgi:hypothetical protein
MMEEGAFDDFIPDAMRLLCDPLVIPIMHVFDGANDLTAPLEAAKGMAASLVQAPCPSVLTRSIGVLRAMIEAREDLALWFRTWGHDPIATVFATRGLLDFTARRVHDSSDSSSRDVATLIHLLSEIIDDARASVLVTSTSMHRVLRALQVSADVTNDTIWNSYEQSLTLGSSLNKVCARFPDDSIHLEVLKLMVVAMARGGSGSKHIFLVMCLAIYDSKLYRLSTFYDVCIEGGCLPFLRANPLPSDDWCHARDSLTYATFEMTHVIAASYGAVGGSQLLRVRDCFWPLFGTAKNGRTSHFAWPLVDLFLHSPWVLINRVSVERLNDWCSLDYDTCHWVNLRRIADARRSFFLTKTATLDSPLWCPLRNGFVRVPAVASDGHTYDRESLLRYLSNARPISPHTHLPLLNWIAPNYAMAASSGS